MKNRLYNPLEKEYIVLRQQLLGLLQKNGSKKQAENLLRIMENVLLRPSSFDMSSASISQRLSISNSQRLMLMLAVSPAKEHSLMLNNLQTLPLSADNVSLQGRVIQRLASKPKKQFKRKTRSLDFMSLDGISTEKHPAYIQLFLEKWEKGLSFSWGQTQSVSEKALHMKTLSMSSLAWKKTSKKNRTWSRGWRSLATPKLLLLLALYEARLPVDLKRKAYGGSSTIVPHFLSHRKALSRAMLQLQQAIHGRAADKISKELFDVLSGQSQIIKHKITLLSQAHAHRAHITQASY